MDGFTDLEEKIMVVLVKERKTASHTIADASEIAGLLEAENAKLQTDLEHHITALKAANEGWQKSMEDRDRLELQLSEKETQRLGAHKAWMDLNAEEQKTAHENRELRDALEKQKRHNGALEIAIQEAHRDTDNANRLNGELQKALQTLDVILDDHGYPKGGTARNVIEDALKEQQTEKRVGAPSICMVQTGCMGGVCGKLLPCDDHVKLNEMCWCAAKAEAKDAVCPIHG